MFYVHKGIKLGDNFEIPPTLLAVFVYEKVSEVLNNFSPYLEIKTNSIMQARIYKQDFMKHLEAMLKQNLDIKEILEYAVRICVLGNVIDYGAQCSFDLELESKKILKEYFAYFV